MIEAVVIASATFLVVVAAVSASIRVVVGGAELQEAARAGAIHGARHGDVESARRMAESLYPGAAVTVTRSGDSIVAAASVLVDLAHPGGPVLTVLVGRAEMPLAPFRSDRG